jgi:hypothetical protein
MIFFDLLNHDNYIRLAGLLFIITAILRVKYVKVREEEIKILKLPNVFQYIIILCQIILGFLLLILYETRLVLFINLLFIALGTIILFINNYSKIMSDMYCSWALQPTSRSLIMYSYTMIFLILLLYP